MPNPKNLEGGRDDFKALVLQRDGDGVLIEGSGAEIEGGGGGGFDPVLDLEVEIDEGARAGRKRIDPEACNVDLSGEVGVDDEGPAVGEIG